jgi:hypothetical protein
MSTGFDLASQFADHLQNVFLETPWTQAITYTDPLSGSTPVNLQVDASQEESEDVANDTDRTERRIRFFTVSRDPTAPSGGIAEPKHDAAVMCEGIAYAVESIEAMDEWSATLKCVRLGKMARSRPGIGMK